MSSWEYERWDGEKRTLYYYEPFPAVPEPYTPDVHERALAVRDRLQSALVRVLFPKGFPRL